MKDVLRKAVLLGMGSFQYLKEGLQDLVKDLEKDGKLTTDEGKKLVDELLAEGKKSSKKYGKDMGKMMEGMVDELGLATKKDLKSLEKKITKK